MTPRLLIRPEDAVAGHARLDERAAHYVGVVLRLEAGAPVQAFDGAGARYAARIVSIGRREAELAIVERIPGVPGQPTPITLAQGIAQADRMDLVVEKATELGAARIVPLLTDRCGVRLDATRAARRHEHWQRIVVAACMQCGLDRLPEVVEPTTLQAWLQRTANAPCQRLLLAPDAPQRLSRVALEAGRPIDVLAGPESGLSPAEVEALARAGFVPVRLGPRTLRTETAGLAAIAAIASRVGDF